jgi:hypothetical protein
MGRQVGFVGRRQELGRLNAALARAADGQPAVVLIGGEAGVGKTRLVAEFAERAGAAGVRVLAGGCVRLGEDALPYVPFSEALRGLVRSLDPPAVDALVGEGRAELARLVPDLGAPEPAAQLRGSGDWTQARLFALVLGLLERLAGMAPLVLVVEDLHWADQSSLQLLSFLVHGLPQAPVVLVVTYRSDEPPGRHRLPPLLAELDRAASVERLELRRFDRAELGVLLAGVLGQPPEPNLLDEVFARSEGNPFFAEELLAGGAPGGRPALSATLKDLLLARVEVLPGPAREVARVAAAAGRRVRDRLLGAACSLKELALLATLRELVAGQVLVADAAGDGYAFRHALLQEVIDADLLPGERRRLHGILARTLAAHPELAGGTPAERAAELAVHWYASGELTRALPAAVDAGMAAMHALRSPRPVATSSGRWRCGSRSRQRPTGWRWTGRDCASGLPRRRTWPAISPERLPWSGRRWATSTPHASRSGPGCCTSASAATCGSRATAGRWAPTRQQPASFRESRRRPSGPGSWPSRPTGCLWPRRCARRGPAPRRRLPWHSRWMPWR